MNTSPLKQIIDALLFDISQLAGTTIPRVAGVLIGLLIGVLVIVGRWERRLRIAATLGGLLVGGFVLAVSVDTRILHALSGSTFLFRIRLLLGLLSILVMAVTFESIRISRLRERYALLWVATSMMVLLTALYPQVVHFLTVILGVQYVSAVVAVVFTFLLLVVFHFSIALSGIEEDRAKIAQRCALLDLRLASVEQRLGLAAQDEPIDALREQTGRLSARSGAARLPRLRGVRGSEAASLAIMLLAVCAVLFVGLRTREPMIGDEVTHYFMALRQIRELPRPSFVAEIPVAWSDVPLIRPNPHPNGWHYLGAVMLRLTGGGVGVLHVYHAFFWLQLLIVGFAWSRDRGGTRSRAVLLYTLVIASIPMNLLFSVAFYQDVPMAAQALTAFWLLDTRRPIRAFFFMALAMWIKVTGIIFLPPFLIMAVVYAVKHPCAWRQGLVVALLCVMPGFAMWGNSWALRTQIGAPYYPVQQVSRLIKGLTPVPARHKREMRAIRPAAPAPEDQVAHDRAAVRRAEIIANHPGDLRSPANFIIYGGVLVWLTLAGALLGLVRPRSSKIPIAASRRRAWPMAVGLFYIVVVAWQLRTAPDARFFLPALPFFMIPACEWCMRLPKSRWILIGAAVLGLWQGVHVLNTAIGLRGVPDGVQESIVYLRKNPPEPRRIFMYPEGNYRLFPAPPEWHLGYWLREFWRGDNDTRLAYLHRYQVGAVVVKKHLIAEVDEAITNLGVYPAGFVNDLRADPRFENVFENEAVVIFRVPL